MIEAEGLRFFSSTFVRMVLGWVSDQELQCCQSNDSHGIDSGKACSMKVLRPHVLFILDIPPPLVGQLTAFLDTCHERHLF